MKRFDRAETAGGAGGAGGVLLSFLTVIFFSLSLSAASPAIDAAFVQFWKARTPADAAKAIDALVKSGVTFDEAFARLKKGRTYTSDVPRGIVKQTHRLGANDFAYMLDVPQAYDPAKQYQVRIQLHGGVSRPDPAQRGNGIGSLAGDEQIYVMPTAWAAATWWTNRQLENVRTILDSVKRTYNVDENRVVLSGVSDGGTGTYYLAMRDTTPFASFLPLNGSLAVLQGAGPDIDGELFPNNFVNKPFFIVNGGRDPLYPTADVEPFIEQMAKTGVTVKYLPQPDAGHNTAWWPDVKDAYEAFVRKHPRNPLPDTLTWESDLTAGTNRADWLVIETLAKTPAEAPGLRDVNDFITEPLPNFGAGVAGTRVMALAPEGNAARFGLRVGDMILQVNGAAIPPRVNALEVIWSHEARTPMTLLVSRDDMPVELKGTYEPIMQSRILRMFGHNEPSGRVDLVREGNTVIATTRRVAEFTLLLSPDAFDFAQPVKVVADGRTVFEGRVAKSLATLVKWAARDNDRTVLFGAELKVKLTP